MYETASPYASVFSFDRNIFFTFYQSCTSNPNPANGRSIDVDVLTSDGVWESTRTNSNSPGYSDINNYWPWRSLYVSDYGPQILNMRCVAPAKGDCTGYYDKLQAIKVCWSPATNACKATTIGSIVPSTLSYQNLTGLWYDPKFTGSGFNVLASGSGFLVTYYGWDSNHNRLWLASDTGPTQITAGAAITLNMWKTNGGAFYAPAPPPSKTLWGTLTLNFSSCKAATATLSGSDGSVPQNIVLLAGVAGAPTC